MIKTTLSLLAGLFSALLPTSSLTGLNAPLNGTYQCQPLKWITPPDVGSDNRFHGLVTVTCDFDGLSGGGYPELETFLIDQLKKEAKQIYAGPVYSQEEGMPSTFYDFSMDILFSGQTATAREEGTVASDGATRLFSVTSTKNVEGSGNVQYIKKFDLRFDVIPATSPQSGPQNELAAKRYHANIGANIEVEKPWYAPRETFRAEVQKAIENSVRTYQDKIVLELENNI